jgi:mannose-1-phosphate guanylyltransferase
MRVELVYEPALTGPFGGVLACRRELAAEDDLLVFAGDGLYEANFAGILARHRELDAELTMGVAAVDDGSRYGVVSMDSEGRITRMREKPSGVGPVQDASCGIYVVSKRLLTRFAEKAPSLDWIDVVTTLIGEGALVVAARIDEWHDLGTPSDLLKANMDLLAGNRISLIANEIENLKASIWSQGEHRIDISGVTFEGRILIGSDVEIGSGAVIGNSVLGPGVRIEAEARVYDSVILPGGRVSAGTSVVGTVWG